LDGGLIHSRLCRLPGREALDNLLIATNNPAKLREYEEILAGLPFVLTSLREQRIFDDVEETGSTFSENASLKAVTYARISGLVSLADDSGLEVRALGGEPGVWSKRYAGEDATDAERIAFLLRRLEGAALEERQARFRCVIAIASQDGLTHFCEGSVVGLIAFEPRGQSGFGYDPVFYLPDYGCTMAEITTAEKNYISHRARAGKAARAFLAQFAGQIPG
jgi:XTP/dITP diphosphohydrolase